MRFLTSVVWGIALTLLLQSVLLSALYLPHVLAGTVSARIGQMMSDEGWFVFLVLGSGVCFIITAMIVWFLTGNDRRVR